MSIRRDVRRRNSSWVLVSAVAFALGTSGCVAPPSGLPVVEGEEQDDIPVPSHFEFRRGGSPDLGTIEKFRSYSARYEGGGKLADLAPWYIEAMGKHGWELDSMTKLGEGTLSEETELRFEKGDEYSLVRIHREMNAERGALTNIVDIEIHPLGTEDLTVEESLRLGTAEPQTTGYTSEDVDSETTDATARDGEPRDGEPVDPAVTPRPTRRSVYEEIEAAERAQQP